MIRRRLQSTIVASLFALILAPCVFAQSKVNFSRQILPILSNKCFVCHGPDAEADDNLRLDSYESATQDLGGYHAIHPDEPAESQILIRIHDADDPMPPLDAEKQLTEEERKLLDQWVREGGSYAKHWAFVPPQKSELPDANQANTNPVDAFVAARLAEQGLQFAAPADKHTLARRAALVLTGLPPDTDELQQFLDDHRDDAYARFVERLLANPGFGEHQARYWLDAVRYGDTHGLHLDNRRGIYPYRDWVVRAMNQNLPLDEFITWQLAGDLLPNPTVPQLVATGYVRMNPTTSEGGVIPAEFQAKNNFDRVENLGTVLLGVTLNCCRCHTHKYDPITQTEFYNLFAFFNSTAESALDGNKYDYGPVIKAPTDQAAWDAWQLLTDELTALLENADSQVTTLDSLREADLTAWRTADATERLALLADASGSFKQLEGHSSAIDLQHRFKAAEEQFTTTLVAKELQQPRETYLLNRGEYDQPKGEALEPAVPSVMGSLPKDAPRNRLGLARWLTSPDHPLVSRVIMNQIWIRTFGLGLVRTPEDFGLQGEQPTHPELLDWLAVELQESGWDHKHMLRMLVNSRTFQQSSAWRSDVEDADNRLWARGPRFRLDAEVLRDIGLWASQLLDPHMGGEGVKPYQPPGMWLAMAHPASNTKQYVRDEGTRLYRRSLYVYWKRTSPHPMMTLFDAPNRESSCVRRSRTNTSLQSLGLLNETQRVEMARKFAERLVKTADNDSQRIDQMFRLLACRAANDREQAACVQLLELMRKRYSGSADDAKSLLTIGDAGTDDSLNATEVAAWTQVCATVLASDIALMLY
ncbi:MAG: PSD1 domain-containing protein [Planctomycetales bacterium]|nr:PSD1 domain-containing protein [Planctomycetales bacterium]